MNGKLLVLRVLVSLMLVAAGCASEDTGLTPTQQVYESVMNGRLHDALTEVVVLSHTEAQYLREEDNEHLRAYIQREVNVSDAVLDRLFESAQYSVELDWSPVMINARLVDKAEISSDSDWRSRNFGDDFRATFPEQESFYALSSVAFNDNQTEAALVLSYYCPQLCGGGEFLLHLEKIGMEWKVQGITIFWIT